MNPPRNLLALVLVCAVACGGNAVGVDGSYRGQSIDVSDGLLMPPQRGTDGSQITVVALESESDACTLAQSRAINNTRLLTVALAIETPDGILAPATVAGTYQIGGGPFLAAGTKLAGVRFGVIGSCGAGTVTDARSGTVHLGHVQLNGDGSIAHIDGTFDAVFDSGEHASGHFGVSACSQARLVFAVCQ
jgi:hypothetical protein